MWRKIVVNISNSSKKMLLEIERFCENVGSVTKAGGGDTEKLRLDDKWEEDY